jgi:membrane carboxypeptidase/penicillin-binding protein PbpC
MGFSPALVTGVWVGNATSQSLAPKADGLSSAAPLWKQFMMSAHKILKASGAAFARPDGLIEPQISKLSGELPTACTPVELRRSDLFLDDHPPTKEDPACQLLKVDKVTNLLASDACPQDAVEEKAFFLPSSEQPLRWPLWEQSVQDWAKKQMELWNASETHSGSQLPLPLAPTESCDPAKTPGRGETPTISILSPDDGESMTFPAFTAEIRIGSLAKISKVEFFVDDLKIRTDENPLSKNLSVSIRMPRNAKKEGDHVLKVSVTNEYFTEAHESVRFTFGEDLRSTSSDTND